MLAPVQLPPTSFFGPGWAFCMEGGQGLEHRAVVYFRDAVGLRRFVRTSTVEVPDHYGTALCHIHPIPRRAVDRLLRTQGWYKESPLPVGRPGS